jgi:hypothetical protein
VSGPLLVTNPDLLPQAELDKVKAYKGGPVLLLGGEIDSGRQNSFEITMENGWGKTVFAGWGGIPEYGCRTFSNDNKPEVNVETLRDPVGAVWTHPLIFSDIEEGFVRRCVEIMTDLTEYPTVSDSRSACNVTSVYTGPDTMKILVENQEYFYVLPWVDIRREIVEIKALTKPPGYPIRVEGSRFKLRVPGRGMDVVEIKFK